MPVRATVADRLTAQGLSGEPARDPVAVAARLLAVRGQDPRGARLAVRARTAGLSAADVDRALTEDRSLLITWLNRGTLHLVRSEDYPWLHALTTPPLLTSSARRGSHPRRRGAWRGDDRAAWQDHQEGGFGARGRRGRGARVHG